MRYAKVTDLNALCLHVCNDDTCRYATIVYICLLILLVAIASRNTIRHTDRPARRIADPLETRSTNDNAATLCIHRCSVTMRAAKQTSRLRVNSCPEISKTLLQAYPILAPEPKPSIQKNFM